MASTKKWLPLEANPDIMNQFLWGLGVSPGEAECFDVYGLDEELLAMVPQPVLAVLFLYPLTEKSEKERVQQDASLKLRGLTWTNSSRPLPIWIRQSVQNFLKMIEKWKLPIQLQQLLVKLRHRIMSTHISYALHVQMDNCTSLMEGELDLFLTVHLRLSLYYRMLLKLFKRLSRKTLIQSTLM